MSNDSQCKENAGNVFTSKMFFFYKDFLIARIVLNKAKCR